MLQEHTIVAIATPPGKGAIAVVRLSGRDSHEVALKVFVPKNKERLSASRNSYFASYGCFFEDTKKVDDGISLFFRSPCSYTGEDSVEFYCHGGEEVSAQVMQACVRAGASPASPGEFTQRAFINGKMSLTQAEAVMELIDASSRSGAQAARAALDGALQRKISEIKQKLLELAAHISAWVDYPEEDVPELSYENFTLEVNEAMAELKELVDGYENGVIIRRGVSAAIVGSPNVGKSTLFNLMSGFERSIVTSIAGTTRDVVREQLNIGGINLLLADTAGLRHSEDEVEKEGIRRSGCEMENAALVIAVFDGSTPFSEDDRQVAIQCKGRLALAIINKSDLSLQMQEDELKPYFGSVVQVSALSENTPKILKNKIYTLLRLNDVDCDAPMLQNKRQLSAALDAKAALENSLQAIDIGLDAADVCLGQALSALARLSGEDVSSAVVEEVFSKYCVGK